MTNEHESDTRTASPEHSHVQQLTFDWFVMCSHCWPMCAPIDVGPFNYIAVGSGLLCAPSDAASNAVVDLLKNTRNAHRNTRARSLHFRCVRVALQTCRIIHNICRNSNPRPLASRWVHRIRNAAPHTWLSHVHRTFILRWGPL